MDIIARAAHLFGAAPALRTADRTLSFAECDTEATRIAVRFLEAGARAGEIVALLSPNSPEAVLVLLGMLKAGLIAAPLNHRLPETQLRGMIDRLQPALLFHAGSPASLFDEKKAIELSSLFTEELPSIRSAALDPPEAMERLVSVIHTSASSGVAKAAAHSFANHWYSALGSNENIAFGPGDCWLLSLPLCHVGGYALLFRAFAGGGSLALNYPQTTIEEALKNHPVTHLSLVPTQLYRILANGEAASRLGSLKAILLGGSPAPQSLFDEAASHNIPLYMSYGSTEMSSQIATTSGTAGGRAEQSGKVLQWREVMTAADGELLVRGETLFQGYLSLGRLTPQTDSQGWFHTSDIGQVAEDGTVRVLGRKDNMFISGGENIHPEEIEKALMSQEGILEAIVVPVPDPEYSLRPVAFIRAANGGCDDETLRKAVQCMVGTLKTPVRLVRVEAWVTLSGSQKIDRMWYIREASASGRTPLEPQHRE
ncbi:MAG: o-succinylbenzoate--CoA ligase [Chlorobiaceae bacterium]